MPHDALLEYRDPRLHVRVPSKAMALLLCAPGGACWTDYWIDTFAATALPQRVGDVLGAMFWPLFFAAVLTAIVSLIIFGRHPLRPQPWYIMLNLAINVSGLVFAAAWILALL